MSDFFYKEKLGPVLSPVIKVKRNNLSPTIVSAIDNLLSPAGDMFTRAETVRNLMKIEKLGLDETARVLSIRRTDVANKLRLLEFSKKERLAILDYGFSEAYALEFLEFDKSSRLYVMEYCRKNDVPKEKVKECTALFQRNHSGFEAEKKSSESVRKYVIKDIVFVVNSIESTLKTARNAGFEIENHTEENEDSFNIHINLRKRKRREL